ncbi:precorrin-8X methylmutase [Desulfovibrio sulfodismutans]|uniref:Precorrin-8X methylmutase n=1 Tax=Desulfolutivibrio sulfodismutans TaxID=63561 RepID=A0A7K3NPR6_9BACT|nr:precorrin-8X methylmutase [Desulfolutivibrio sulfodismutans]NDY57795.1 precorrin-8X methylmutase [Desulfolutivibrio sulfodismutans]QLA13622.1 precorrin-8X methylmutase [Desulfolutivibrio sulfodismutans DSM 3696]
MNDRTPPPAPLQQERRPDDIERASLAIIDAEVPEPRPFAGAQWEVVRRMIHATADFELLSLVRLHPRAVESGLAALAAGAVIVTDTRMACMGIPERRLTPLGCRVTCLIDDPRAAPAAAKAAPEAFTDAATAAATTRTAAAVDLAVSLAHGPGIVPGMSGAPVIFVIGNAPTALLRLLDHMQAGRIRPALVAGLPVGFVNAAQSKALLADFGDSARGVPYLTVVGRKGGSTSAAAAINALLELALRERARTEEARRVP